MLLVVTRCVALSDRLPRFASPAHVAAWWEDEACTRDPQVRAAFQPAMLDHVNDFPGLGKTWWPRDFGNDLEAAPFVALPGSAEWRAGAEASSVAAPGPPPSFSARPPKEVRRLAWRPPGHTARPLVPTPTLGSMRLQAWATGASNKLAGALKQGLRLTERETGGGTTLMVPEGMLVLSIVKNSGRAARPATGASVAAACGHPALALCFPAAGCLWVGCAAFACASPLTAGAGSLSVGLSRQAARALPAPPPSSHTLKRCKRPVDSPEAVRYGFYCSACRQVWRYEEEPKDTVCTGTGHSGWRLAHQPWRTWTGRPREGLRQGRDAPATLTPHAQPNTCAACGRTFTRAASLRRHLHAGPCTRVVCFVPGCDKSLSSWGHLGRHLREDCQSKEVVLEALEEEEVAQQVVGRSSLPAPLTKREGWLQSDGSLHLPRSGTGLVKAVVALAAAKGWLPLRGAADAILEAALLQPTG